MVDGRICAETNMIVTYGCISNDQYVCSVSDGRQETFCITYLINNSMSDKLMPAPSASLYFHFVVDTRYLLDLVSTIDFNGPYTANIYDKNTRKIHAGLYS